MTPFYLLLAALFLGLNAFFVLAEFAIVKVRATRLAALAQKGNRRARAAQEILRELDIYLSVCQLGITIASLALGWLGEPAFGALLRPLLAEWPLLSATLSHTLSVCLAFTLITFLHILLGELVPKSLAIRTPERSAIAVAAPLRLTRTLFHPALVVLNAAQNAILRLLGVEEGAVHEGTYSEDELRLILSHSEERGEIPLERLLLFENLFDFGKLKARDAMVPIAKAEGIDLRIPKEGTLTFLRANTRSRLLVNEGDPTRPVGILHVKDLLRACLGLAADELPDLKTLVRPLASIPEDLPLEGAMREMQRKRTHLVLVADAKGRGVGILSFEDILEELVGNIEDEFEKHPLYLLADLMRPEAVVLSLSARTSHEAIRELCGAIVGTFATPIPPGRIEEAVLERERAAHTHLGNGIAVPHARIEGLKAPRIAVGRSEQGIVFDRLATEPARLVFLVLAPAEQPQALLQILSRIAGLAQSAYLRARLLEATDAAEILDTVRSGDPRTH